MRRRVGRCVGGCERVWDNFPAGIPLSRLLQFVDYMRLMYGHDSSLPMSSAGS